MAKKTKKQSQRAEQDDGRIFMQRLQKNLEFFQKRRPGLYKLLANMELQSVELVVTPGKNDVDMVANGVSCYRGLAREYSVDEATRVLSENPESKRILTYAPPWERSYSRENFADHILRNIVKASPVTPATFKGYIRGNVFPSMVFLGCGLGYHIDELTKKVPIINGIIIEREPEKFAVSLYTVDWEEICSRFSRKGFSLTFAIGKASHPEEIRRLVRQYMTRDVPFYPFFSTYYNHLADVDLAKAVLENANDLAVITTNWSHYDNELMRLSNAVHNIRRGGRYLPRLDGLKQDKPLVIVGSGPSLDARVKSLIKVRDKVVVVSCGTSLKPLLAHGVRPDVHVELDPSYRLHELHQDIGEDKLRDLPLLAVSEVNPFVTTLFRKVFYYFKFDNAQCSLVGVKGKAFANCNPTVTNAALSIGYGLGFRKIFLFGTDYGFESVEKDHSAKSIYGSDSDSGLSREYQERATRENKQRKIFSVPSVKGGTVLTRNDYYTAKRSVEDLIVNLKSTETPPQIYNCGDGAVIEGTNWLDDSGFFHEMEQVPLSEGVVLEDFLDQLSEELGNDSIDDLLSGVHGEIQKLCNGYERMLRSARLNGRRDLCNLVNEIRETLAVLRPHAGEASVTGVQVMAFQVLKGTLQHFMYVGLCHGMACEDDELVDFVRAWKGGFEEFLGMVPGHFHKVLVMKRAIEADPWAKRHKGDRDPEYSPEQTVSAS